jgi:hypothetical protein
MADTTSTQIVAESPAVEAYKLNLMKAAAALQPPALPQYQIAGMTPQQTASIELGQQGIGAYAPYLSAANQSLVQGAGNLGTAADIYRGADTRNQFAAGQAAYNAAAIPASQIGQLAGIAGAGYGNIGQGAQAIQNAQQMAQQSAYQPGFAQGIASLAQGAQQGANAANLGAAPMMSAAQMGPAQQVNAQNVSAQDINAAQMGPAQQVSTQSFAQPGAAEAYMSPYMQSVVDIQKREAARQSGIQGTQQQAQATQAGAFGGARDAIQRAERERNLSQQMGDIQAQGSQAAYSQAQQQFNAEQQARLAAQQANQQAGLTVGAQNLNAEQQAAVQNVANQLQASGMNAQQAMQAALANQQAGLTVGSQNLSAQQQAAAANQALQGQYGLTKGQMGLQAAGLTQNVGQGQLNAASQQGGLQQGAAGLYGNLGSQQAGLASLYGNVAGQQAGILGQQSQLQQQLGQGIGNLAAQQFGVGAQLAQGIGSLGTQLGNLGTQQAALSQTAQQLNANDVNQLYTLGAEQQKQQQAVLDATRASQMQNALQPYQQLAFQSDIYKGAPSSQMAVSTQAAPTASPFQQIAGVGTGLITGAAAANKLGLF